MRLCSLALFAALLVLASCVAPVDTNQAAGPLSLSVVSGNNQTGPPGTELPAPIVALVEDSRGHAVRGLAQQHIVRISDLIHQRIQIRGSAQGACKRADLSLQLC